MNEPTLPDGIFRLRLFIAAGTPNAAQAVANLTAICKAHLHGRHELELIDVFAQPQRALDDRVLMTPTLMKLSPGPPARCVGTLSDEAMVLDMLGVAATLP